MSVDLRVIGIDPGPVPGLVQLDLWVRHDRAGRFLEGEADVLQCSAALLPDLLEAVLIRAGGDDWRVLVAVEQFVVSGRSGRSATAQAGARTRDLIGEIQRTCDGAAPATSVVKRSAAAVKPWATDVRLQQADLWRATAGMRHARDAARHALFAAVHDGGLPDPLSKEFSR